MQTNTNNIRVSVFPEVVRADMKVTQNDIDTNEVIVRVFDQSDVEIDYATITSALIIFTKPDYHVVQGNMEVREDDLYYKMGTNEIAVKGDVKAQIQLIGSSGERLTIGGFSFTVQADPVTPWTVQSSSEYGILHSLIVEAQAAINDVDALSLWENYNPTKPYIPLNKVVYNGSCYINFVACQGVLPTDASKWLKIASRGEDGADGKDGADGIDATITIGTVTTGAAGTSATVNNVGTPSNAVFNFSIPKGDKGDPFTVDASDMLANMSLYDYEPTGFSFLATDTGKIYFKNSNTPGDWSDPIGFEGPAGPGVPQGGTTGQFLRKSSSADYEASWSDLPISNILTGTSTTKALSEAQGKVLKDAVDAVQTNLTTHIGAADPHNQYVLDTEFDAHKADNTYQTPTIVGTQIQLIKQSDTARLFFKLDADLSGGAITISLDAGATSKPLVDIDGVAVTELDKGFVEVVENAVNFTYAPKGGKSIKGLIITPSTVNQAIPKGMHDGLGYVKGDANLLAENIKKDKNIFGVIGTLSECKTFSQSFSQPKGSKSITLSASPGFTPVLVIGKVTLSFQESSSSWSNLFISQIRVSDYFSSSGLNLFDKLLTYKYGSSEREMNGVEDGYGWGQGAFVTAGGGINYTTTRTVDPTDYGCQGVTSCSVTCYYME